jgi:hypothetical protein
MQAYHNELVSKISHLGEENIKLKKEKVGRIFHFYQFAFSFSINTCQPLLEGRWKEMAKWPDACTKLELVFQTFNLGFGAVQINMYSELF